MTSNEIARVAKLMVQPAANAAAFASLSLGFASQAMGIWAGMATGAIQASQRLFPVDAQKPEQPPLAAEPERSTSSPTLTLLEGGAPKRAAKPGETATATESAGVQLGLQNAPATSAPAKSVQNAAASAAALGDPEMGKDFARKSEAKAAGEARAGKTKAAESVQAEAASRHAATPVSGAAARQRRQPKAADRPEAPDDFKAISGIGPKLEKVLNGLGIWTYAQLAGLAAGEIGWLEDHLGFVGRIGRDDWLGQARALASPKN